MQPRSKFDTFYWCFEFPLCCIIGLAIAFLIYLQV